MSGCDIRATKLLTSLTICVLLCIDPSNANDNTMLIAPSYTQNPLLRKRNDKQKDLGKWLKIFLF